MLKIISSIFIFLITLILILISFLITGIEIDSISYKNIKIDKLYVKYDGKLRFNTQNIAFLDQDDKSIVDMRIKFEVQRLFDNYLIKVDEYHLKDPHIKAHGDIVLDPANIDFSETSKVYINNFSLQFSRSLKYVKSPKCYVEYKNDSFYFSFDDPVYEGVNLKESEVAILDYDRVKVDLRSKDIIKKPLLELLKHYDIELPITQDHGKNDTFVSLLIPFDIKKGMDTYLDIKVKDSKIYIHGTPLLVDNAFVTLNKNILDVNGKILKNNMEDINLTYDVDLNGKVDFNDDISYGTFKINNGSYFGLDTNKTEGDFKIYFKKEFISDLIFDNNSTINIYGERFTLNDSSTRFINKKKVFISKIDATHKKYPLKLDINDTFYIDSLLSKGKGGFSFDNKKLISNKKGFIYSIDYNDELGINLNADDINGSFLGYRFIVGDLNISYKDKVVFGDSSFKTLNNGVYMDSKKLDLNISIEDDIDIHVNSEKSDLNLYGEDFLLKDINVNYNSKDDKIIIDNKLVNDEHEYALSFNNIFDLKKDRLKGNLSFNTKRKNRFNLTSESMDYWVNYKDDQVVHIPKFGLDYLKKDDEYTLWINDFENLSKYIPEIDGSKKSSIYLTSKDFKDIYVNINNLYLDINSSKYPELFKTTGDGSPSLVDLHLKGEKGSVKFNGFRFDYDKVSYESKNNNITAVLNKDKTALALAYYNNHLVVKSNSLENKYVNNIFGKNWFEEGKMDVFIMQKNGNYEGKVDLHQTVLKDVQLVNNLLLFINSTPGIINPLLALPTLLRLTQTGFEIDGYYIDNGYLKFIYDKNKEHLNIHEFKTNGKMNNFEGKVHLDIPNNKVNGSVDVVFMKDYAKVINKIPVLGYVFLGKDGDIQTKVDINGTIDDPKFHTNTIKGVIKGMGNTIKRALGQ